MDAFEYIAARLLEAQGYWTRICYVAPAPPARHRRVQTRH